LPIVKILLYKSLNGYISSYRGILKQIFLKPPLQQINLPAFPNCYLPGTLKEMWKYEKVRQDHKEGVHGIDGLTREVDKTNLFRSQV
jgi:hypothetical protein